MLYKQDPCCDFEMHQLQQNHRILNEMLYKFMNMTVTMIDTHISVVCSSPEDCEMTVLKSKSSLLQP